MRISSVTSRVLVLTAATQLLPVAPPALAQTDIHSEQKKLLAMDAAGGEAFGRSVSISGNRIVVGAPSDDDAGNSYSVSALLTPSGFRRQGSTTASFVPAAGSAYYLVVTSNGFREGSYGVDSAGNQRMQSFNSCLPQSIGSCE